MNTNYNESIFLHENDLTSNENKALGFKETIFSIDENKKTLLIEMSENSKLSHEPITESVEIFVLEGVYSNEFGSFKKGTYLKLPKEQLDKVFCTSSCKIFKKSNYFNDDTKVIIDTNTSQWAQGHGNLKVLSLYESTALVKWPKDEVFIPHSHWGGEEVYVLSGTFMDEHGEYKKDTWIRNHHRSVHHPFVKEETIIFVKTGHLLL